MKEILVLIIFLALCSGSHGQSKVAHSNGRIVGGSNAWKKYRKGTALIYEEYDDGERNAICTASIIGDRWLLTAAHCFNDLGDSNVFYGAVPNSRYADIRDSSKTMAAKHIYIYKTYDADELKNDVAVIQLKRRLKRRSYTKVRIVSPPSDNSRVMAVGYGNLNEDGQEAKFLMQAELRYRTYEWCTENEENFNSTDPFWNEDAFLCAVSRDYPNSSKDICDGDSGGPLFKKVSGSRLYQIGVTSFSYFECGEKNAIPWYVRASFYKRDIIKLVKTRRWKSKWNRYTSPF